MRFLFINTKNMGFFNNIFKPRAEAPVQEPGEGGASTSGGEKTIETPPSLDDIQAQAEQAGEAADPVEKPETTTDVPMPKNGPDQAAS